MAEYYESEAKTDRRSEINEAMFRCEKAYGSLCEAWETLQHRLDMVIRPNTPLVDRDQIAETAVRDIESPHRQSLNGHASRLENIVLSIRNVTDRLDI